MTSIVPATHALALEVRDMGNGALLGVGFVFPSARYLAILPDGADRPTEANLTADAAIVRRTASIPISVTSPTELAPLAARLLPALLKARGSAA